VSLQQSQQAFINHIKDPDNHPKVNGIEDRRMKIYRELFFNNILGFINGGFPVLSSLYQEDDWKQLVRQANRKYKPPLFEQPIHSNR